MRMKIGFFEQNQVMMHQADYQKLNQTKKNVIKIS